MKRVFDFIASLIGFVLVLPIFLIISILIKMESKGPIFFMQERIGQFGKPFMLFKFRSMKVGASSAGLLTVGDKDPRVTQVGFFLRKYKIDELPQLINVLLGEMSFVGPRPEVKKYTDLYSENQRIVLSVKPGITDMASIVYRNESEILKEKENPEKFYVDYIMPDKIDINLRYLELSQSVSGSIKIVFKTMVSIFRTK